MTSTDHPRYRTFRDQLPAPVWHELLSIGSPKLYRPGDVLLREGSEDTFVLVVVEGVCKVVAARPGRGQTLIAVRGPGDTLGEFSAIDDARRSASVYAVTECRTRLVRGTTFVGFLSRHRLEATLSRYLSAKLRWNSTMVSELAGLSVRAKVAWLLMRLATMAAPDTFIPLYQKEMAELLGVAASSVKAALGHFREQGLLRTEVGGVHLLALDALTDEIHSDNLE
ncbi:Crp/Fnr family transcriptional regulator [Saccharopolyspora indica]|uniref:Crp/Fnr family transcriptional regulator n=1 Tax=Saccharopolyspora indica TaxID=1229659 RepID=UPI0022EB4F70|nr:Crp/Fnr family transcriptional regulator [Saccharopolyspora indica]MDA3649939.1 Crp/Fnr family transcriptional regulator [Saccharopolyspora indica]